MYIKYKAMCEGNRFFSLLRVLELYSTKRVRKGNDFQYVYEMLIRSEVSRNTDNFWNLKDLLYSFFALFMCYIRQ